MNTTKGYKLVPVEPNDEIIRRMLAVKWPATYRNHLRFDGAGPQPAEQTERHIAEATKQYSAAISAAPTPPQPIYDEEVVAWEVTGGGVRPAVFTFKPGWAVEDPAYTVRELVYAKSRAKSVEAGHE